MTKNLKWFLMTVIVSLTMASCDKDDKKDEPNSPVVAESIIGTWVSNESETNEDGIVISKHETITFNADKTGRTSITISASTKATESYTFTENFSWSLSQTSNGVDVVSFIHNSGEEIYGNDRYSYTLAGNILYLAGVRFTKQ